MKMVLCLRCEKKMRDGQKLVRLSNIKRDLCQVCGKKVLCIAWDVKTDAP